MTDYEKLEMLIETVEKLEKRNKYLNQALCVILVRLIEKRDKRNPNASL